MGEGLIFHEDDHRYTYDGVEVPSVTSILKEAYPGYPRYWGDDDRPLHLGTEAHWICRLDDEQDLIEDSMDVENFPELPGLLESWRKFCALGGWKWWGIEQPCHHRGGWAGTPDRIGKGRRGDYKGMTAVIDIKTGLPEKWHTLQTSAYRELWNDRAGKSLQVRGRLTVYLDAWGGAPKIRHGIEDGKDREAWSFVLGLYAWKLERGYV